MPAIVAHICLLEEALKHNDLKNSDVKQLFGNEDLKKYFYLGTVGPDIPFYEEMISSRLFGKMRNEWGDRLHTEKTREFAAELFQIAHKTSSKDISKKRIAFAYGYLSHLIADIRIHPFINRIVGHYENAPSEHRACELHQDAWIYYVLNQKPVTKYKKLPSDLDCSEDEESTVLDSSIWWMLNEAFIRVYHKAPYPSIGESSNQKILRNYDNTLDAGFEDLLKAARIISHPLLNRLVRKVRNFFSDFIKYSWAGKALHLESFLYPSYRSKTMPKFIDPELRGITTDRDAEYYKGYFIKALDEYVGLLNDVEGVINDRTKLVNLLPDESLDTGKERRVLTDAERNYLEIKRLGLFTSKMSVRMTWLFIILFGLILSILSNLIFSQ